MYTVFRCNVRNCNAVCKTTPVHEIFSVIGEHNHFEKKPSSRVVQNLRHSIIELARNRPNDDPSDIFYDAVDEFDLHNFTQTDVDSAKRAINRDRLHNRPTLPKNQDEAFNAMNMAKDMKMKGADMIKGIDRVSGIAMFFSDANLCLLNGHRPKQLFADGTFTYCSRFFHQMYTFHIYRGGFYIPICHFLLPNQQSPTYIKMLSMLKNACRELGFEIDIDYFTIDMEVGMVKAIKTEFPEHSDIRFCSFHVGQAWKKKYEDLGLKKYVMNKKTKTGALLRKIFGLKFLDEDLVRPCFYSIFQNKKTPHVLRPFFNYMEKYYIRPEASFQIRRWANVSNTEIETTTNGAEAFHSWFTFPAAKPNIFYFLEKMHKSKLVASVKSR